MGLDLLKVSLAKGGKKFPKNHFTSTRQIKKEINSILDEKTTIQVSSGYLSASYFKIK